MRGVAFRVQHTCTLPASKAFHRHSSASEASEGKGWGFSSSHTKDRNDLLASVPQLAPTEIYIGSTDRAVQNGF